MPLADWDFFVAAFGIIVALALFFAVRDDVVRKPQRNRHFGGV